MTERKQEQVKRLITEENIHHPLSDEQIGRHLSVLRETVTNIRQDLGIPNSRLRKRNHIHAAIEEIRQKEPELSTSRLLHQLARKGFAISRNYLAGVTEKSTEPPKISTPKELPAALPQDFCRLIGFDRSLMKNIQQGTAAMLYPPQGLPTLISGDSGTGKSLFAECMYQYAVNHNVLPPDAPFLSLNCADYSDNPQLLLSILYGHKKGSFTGADRDSAGLVEQADKGILFLDEIHRLPAKGQEMLFSILDKGKFRRLGETNTEREASLYFIGATTENLESSLLLTFRRRIPMIIELPALENRSIQEKAQLIFDFFQEEANRTKCKIFVKSKILSAFAVKEYPGNIGQLKSEIQVTCANAFVEKINSGKKEINIDFSELLYNTLFHDRQIQGSPPGSAVIFQDTTFTPHISSARIHHTYPVFEDIYQKVELKYNELKNLGISSTETEKIIWTFTLNHFNLIKSGANAENQMGSIDELKYLLGETLCQIMQDFSVKISALYPGIEINKKILLYLALHLGEATKRTKYQQDIVNPNLAYIRGNFKPEYDLAAQLAAEIEEKENVHFSAGEIGFITMYIKEMLQVSDKKNKIALILVCHGKVASEMIAVVNQLMDVNFPIAIDMLFNTNPTKIFEKVIAIAQTLETDTGILFFVDMGSLVHIGEVVQKRTGIKARTIDRVDIVSVMEAVRKISIADQEADKTLDDIYYEIIGSRYAYPIIPAVETSKPPLIACTCLTGHGVAIKMQEMVAASYPNIKTVLLSALDEQLGSKLERLKRQYNLLAIIGTINPRIPGINFIPFETNFSTDKKLLLDHLMKQIKSSSLRNLLKEDFILLNQDCENKQTALEILSNLLFERGYATGEFLHSMLSREEMGSTCFKNKVAVPHGLPAYVNESSILFIRLNQPMLWDTNGNAINLICLPAIKNEDGSIMQDLFRALKDADTVNRLLRADSPQEFIAALCAK